MASNQRKQLEAWLKSIDVPSGVSVVDIGGAQLPIKGRTRSWGANYPVIVDLPQPHELKEDGMSWIGHDIQEGVPPLLADTQFDVCFYLGVSEYLLEPLVALKNVAKMIKSGGILYTNFHFFYPHHNPKGEDLMRYTRWGAVRLLERAGFRIEEINAHHTEIGSLEDVYRAERMHWERSGIDPEEIGYMIKAIKI